MNIYICLFIDQEDSLWHYHITATLRKMGHTVYIPSQIGLQESWYLLSDKQWTSRHQLELTEKILLDVKTKHKQHGVDLFFCYLFPHQFVPSLFTTLSQMSIPSVYFFCDNLSHRLVAEEYGPHATLNWVPEINAIELFEKSSSNAVYLPMGANPDYNYPIPEKEVIDTSFVGGKSPHRRYMLGKAVSDGVEMRIYGKDWRSSTNSGEDSLFSLYLARAKIKSFFRYATLGLRRRKGDSYFDLGEEYESVLQQTLDKEPYLEVCRVYPACLLDLQEINRVYSRSAVSIGFNDQFNELNKLFFHTNLRNFEATMAGACYLAEAAPGLHELFADGEEIMIFHSVDEMIDKAKFLSKNESFRKKLRSACRRRALSEHTWECRFNKLFAVLRYS